MPNFAANLTMMFNEVPFLDRFEAAARAGFTGVEYLFPYDFPADDLAAGLERFGLRQALFNLPPGDWEDGERGLAALPGRENAFRDSVDLAMGYAATLDCSTVHVMAGIVPDGLADKAAVACYVGNLQYAADRFAEHGITVVIEPLNVRDAPGYLLAYQRDARHIIERVGRDNVGLQLDLYHCQIMEGDLSVHLRDFADITRHIQIAGVPERHEPDVGEVNFSVLFDLIDELGYSGWVGCEYRPRGDTAAGLGWFAPYASRARGQRGG